MKEITFALQKSKSNRITEIYSGQLQNLPKIGEIQFGNQALSSIGKETFKDIPSLTKLSFQSTHVGELRPDTFLGLENLVSIDFRSSKLQKIHEGAFAGLFNLEQIALTANGIIELPEIMFEDSSNLKILLMDSNKIESFENTTFSGLFQLERLELQNNNLKFLPEFGFKNLEKVTKLKLSNNKLHQISENDLIGLESLEDLTINDNELNFMNNNKIQVIEPNWFLNIIPRSTQAAQFGLNDNIWNCGCNSTRFRLWYELDENKDLFTTLTKIEHMNCSSPEYMKNFTINGLDLTWFPKSEDDPCEPPPRIWGHPNLSIKRKSEAQLICGIKEGKPQPKYFWKRPDNSTVWTNTSTLTIEAISDADRGVYECKALNIAGESIEKHSVEVTWEDAITDELGNYIGIRGTNSAQSQFLCSFFFYLFIILFFH
ncbi:unnamed protein product [Oikopleura dioica]|uniref:Ig-like domain-containing protein n=1 Tax=Oikopleura dioica TaxID=34765 RepID=E4WQ36_OIKDI|nr:unnamed protein product [Oikopleura dioica]